MAINLNDNVFSASPKLLDAKWGPFPDLTSAYAAVLPSFRKIGMFAIISPPSGPAQLYWYKNDTDTLVPFSGNSSVQVYSAFVNFPPVGSVDVIYVDKSESKSYYWNAAGSNYQLTTSSIEVYANSTAFPQEGVENVIYIADDTNISYVWNPALLNGNGDYEILTGTVTKERVTYHEATGIDTYSVITGKFITSNQVGDAYLIKFSNANTTSPTITIDSASAADLYNTKTGSVLQSGDLEAGVVHLIVYTSSNIFEVLTIGGGAADTGNIRFNASQIYSTDNYVDIHSDDNYVQFSYTNTAYSNSPLEINQNWFWLDNDGANIEVSGNDADGNPYLYGWYFSSSTGILQVPGRISFGGLDWQSIGVGNVNTHGGAYGISLYCTVGYELNWQAGYLAARNYVDPYDIIDIRSDSLIKYATPGDYPTFYSTFDIDTLITKGYLEDQAYLTDAAGSISNDGKTYGRKDGGWSEVVSTGGIPHATASSTDTYTVSITGVTAYNDGDAYLIRFTNGNTTAPTLNINSLGAKTLYRNNDGPLIGGDIFNGGEMICVYNSTLDGFQCIGSSPNSLFAYVTNGEASTISRGQVVYASGGTGDRMVVMLASNSADATSAKTVGVVYSTSIGANQKGIILMQGLIDGLGILKPNPDGWADGDSVYLGATAGSITRTKPSAPNHLVYVATVTTASQGNSGRMYVKIQNGYELDEIHDVQINSGTIATGHYLYYDSTGNGLWKNSASWQGDTIAVTKGGTGLTSYAVGDILYADTTTSLAKLAGVATGNALISGGVGTAPSWGKITESHISLSDVTTLNASTTAHGFLPKLTGSTTAFLRADGTWAAAAGSGSISSGTTRRLAIYTASTTLSDTLGASDALITIASQAAARTYTVPDAGVSAASFIMTAGDQPAISTKSFLGTSKTGPSTTTTQGILLSAVGGSGATETKAVLRIGAVSNAVTSTRNGFISFGTAVDTGDVPTLGTRPQHSKIILDEGDLSTTADMAIGNLGTTTNQTDTMWLSTKTSANGRIAFYVGDTALGYFTAKTSAGAGAAGNLSGNGLVLFATGTQNQAQLSIASSSFGATGAGDSYVWLDFSRHYTAVAVPASVTGSRSKGSRIVLMNNASYNSGHDTSIGVEGTTGAYYTWFNNMTSSAGSGFKFYGTGTLAATINTSGVLALGTTAASGTTPAVQISGTQVVSSRKTGWAAASGTATRTTFATSTVTTAQLAERVKALIDDLISHGLIGT